jgi:hypothetical protein
MSSMLELGVRLRRCQWGVVAQLDSARMPVGGSAVGERPRVWGEGASGGEGVSRGEHEGRGTVQNSLRDVLQFNVHLQRGWNGLGETLSTPTKSTTRGHVP